MPHFSFSRDIRYTLGEIKLRGYKSIEELTTSVKPGLNILIGKNGAGKSNFFEFLTAINSTLYSPEQIPYKSAELVFSSDTGSSFKFGISKLQLKNSDEDSLELPYRLFMEVDDQLVYDSTSEDLSMIAVNGSRIFTPRNLAALFRRLQIRYPGSRYIGFGYPDNVKGLSQPMSIDIPFEQEDFWYLIGTDALLLDDALNNFESALQKVYDNLGDLEDGTEDEKYAQIVSELNSESFLRYAQLDEQALENLKKFSPIQDVRINENMSFYKSDKHIVADNIRLDFLVNDNWLPWSHLSDGTKRLLILITEITLRPDSLILVEEPELGVHPHQFDLVMQFLKEQSRTQQIIVSTHSPKALDIFEEDELDRIMLASYDKRFGTKISHLNEQQIEKALGYMQEVGFLSDYWLLSDLES